MFASKATGASYIKTFDLELIRWLKYLLKFGLFIYRDNAFQTDDVDFIFSYLWHILDIYTGRNYIKSVNNLDKLVAKDTVEDDIAQMDPFSRVGYDIKYKLFNKNFGIQIDYIEEQNDFKEKWKSTSFNSKLLKEVISIFHFFNDLRQQYLMTNNIEYFFSEIYEKSYSSILNLTEEDRHSQAQLLINEFKNIIPDSTNFHNYLKYELPSIDKMYDNDEIYEAKKLSVANDFDQTEMHEEYVSLLVDAFNIHSYNTLLGQMTLLLICRYYSETAEFIRNLDKMALLFDDNDWRLHQWIVQAIDKFVNISEKSNIWFTDINELLEKNQSIENFEILNEVLELDSILSELKNVILYQWSITKSETGEFEMDYNDDVRKINIDAQNLFRNLKVYDYLIDFILINKEFFIKIIKYGEKLNENSPECVKIVRKIWKKIFRVLEYMTKDNTDTQNLMWKYKEEFTMKDLGSKMHEGELDFVLAIIDDSPESVKMNQGQMNVSRAR